MSDIVSLDDKYRLDRQRALIGGRQALVRLPILQRAQDRKQGLNTAGYISGYRGSPLGGYDAELWKAARALKDNDITFEPGVNEDLALTAVAGTQQLDFVPGKTVDGVFGFWYGKGPGVDRSGDAIKHANLLGTSSTGGVVLIFGDDHAGKSSTTAHQSDLTLASWGVPILYPSSVSEILDLGLAAVALSRYSGLLVGLKLVNETAEATGVLDLYVPPTFVPPDLPEPEGGVHIRPELLAVQQQETRLLHHKLPRAEAFAQVNKLDRMVFGSKEPKFVIATAGKAFTDVLAALELLGLEEETSEQIGLGVYKIALIYPLAAGSLVDAARSAEEIFFVEEKRAHAEHQAKLHYFNRDDRPRITGKLTPDGAPLLPADTPLNGDVVALALADRLHACIPDLDVRVPKLASMADRIRDRRARKAAGVPSIMRRPAFCPGCPHSISTKVPPGAIGGTGIGCHGMAIFHPDRNPIPMGHMGAEGANWIGLSKYTDTKHIFQNLGDGTYNHSGSLSIRAAVQSKTNITFKILFNDAVAMTGGQPVEGPLTVTRLVKQVKAEGVKQVVVVSEDPERFLLEALPGGTDVRHRDDLAAVQNALQTQPGVSVLIFDQVCAAEKRRRRKIGAFPDPDRRIFINALVCEGCGDCSIQSNCLAIQPLVTDIGRKRKIDQSACNKDVSCTKGFCPSFVTVEGGRLHQAADKFAFQEPNLPLPALPRMRDSFNMVIAGIGGTGVVTVSAILGMAARLEGFGANLFDMTGLSQKGGAVFSHIRLSRDPGAVTAAKVGAGQADVVLACDLIAATQPECLDAIALGTTIGANTDMMATAGFQTNRDLVIEPTALVGALAKASGRQPFVLSGSSHAETLFGDSIFANLLMLGYVWQLGAIPLPLPAIEEAIKLNGKSADKNLKAFAAGRRAAIAAPQPPAPPPTLQAFIDGRMKDLALYWNKAYAKRYSVVMSSVRDAAAALDGGDAFVWAVARSAYKLMAYKDEYEVARLYSDGRFRDALAAEFREIRTIKIHLAPPLFTRTDPRTGRPRKLAFGAWILPVLRALVPLKALRETPFDIFGYSQERKLERALRDAYLALVAKLVATLAPETLNAAIATAEGPLAVRGFGPVRENAALALLGDLYRQLAAR